ncbi:hypothetical protein ACO0LL_05730 [Undibacterium sp. TC4M20W]|uniref:hypothetical protein n=1 Tax=Undibacterium sp. TC4M20W TaxID=3413052 RepID=UPI003BF1841C
MQTVVFAGHDIPDFDGQITANLVLEVVTEKAVRFERMQIGVRNEHGHIYRAIGVSGLDVFLEVTIELEKIGLTDEIEKYGPSRQGYDAIFKK